MKPIVHIKELDFAFAGTAFRLQVDELSILSGESVALIGPSGSGKTTFLHLLAGIRLPSAGRIIVDGVDVTALDDASRRDLRIRRVARRLLGGNGRARGPHVDHNTHRQEYDHGQLRQQGHR